MRINRDVIVAIALLIICALFINASFRIKEATFGQMSSALWPRIILAPLTILSFVYLVRSLLQSEPVREKRGGLSGWIGYYKNPIVCFFLFFIFLITMPYFGMLIGGILFVFAMLTYLGGYRPRDIVVHGTIAVAAVGIMWSIFTFGLGVILPSGEIIPYL
ncbi:MAG: tripartite tricarboxylate transporter TctB family protein [Rhodospirillaceae bacterium]|jgi:hypothetical protein|nr:tripartite tricarboxylate transporter TctB family protein [Rhodospirillaceae bacterium]MBT4115838.1 tripartite tricarboxylate transporter TctB family protein [Rhodospirillaceae bacterium]MBT4672548.1 tripartite tricarboxylate transporter TctB family protein [Rhodospirillaceae bacterium]MBT4720219.1 tripartite tricarboxylate transporter TctB family protein [Rhodospirillaceae bacterium]MBT4750475.1 tripartite tricarboxylate transporter TctB family protein [Rhodospirillaceae bacterium]